MTETSGAEVFVGPGGRLGGGRTQRLPTLGMADGEQYATIGQFCAALAARIRELGQGAFTGDPQRQVADPTWFPPDQLFAITGVDGALRAIEVIVEQGEGTHTSPGDGDGEPAHYYRFPEIAYGRALVRDRTSAVGWSFSVMVAHGALFGAVAGTFLSLVGGVGATVAAFAIGRAGRPAAEPAGGRGRAPPRGRAAPALGCPGHRAEPPGTDPGRDGGAAGRRLAAGLGPGRAGRGRRHAARGRRLRGRRALAASPASTFTVFGAVLAVAGLLWWVGGRDTGIVEQERPAGATTRPAA